VDFPQRKGMGDGQASMQSSKRKKENEERRKKKLNPTKW